MTLLGAITTDVYHPVTGTRDTAGRWVEGERSLTALELSINPLRGRELERMERLTGQSIAGAIQVFSDEQLYACDPPQGKKGSWVVWRGTVYEVYEANRWEDQNIPCWESNAIRLEPQPTLPTP